MLVNGIPGESFLPLRGIRQGDPPSPYIVILCAETLARQLQATSISGSQSIGVTLGHPGVKIPFLTFADNTVIFAKASQESCYIIKNILNKHCSMLGQLVNFSKSAFQCSQNTNPHLLVNFSSIFRCKILSL